MRALPALALTLCLALGAPVRPAAAVDAPYEAGLMRLAEVLGSLHFLRNLCGEQGTSWRDEMEKLLASEAPDADRRARLVASFNRGYRTFDGTYGQCTDSAVEAINRYMKEGQALSRDIAMRYGN